MKITAAHGAGGKATGELISTIFKKHFGNEILNRMEDAAAVPAGGRIAVTTDSFVITPLFFKGGNIGKLAVCGTVNDLLMAGAEPRYLTVGFILEEGLDVEILDQVAASLSAAADEAGVKIIAGDTKVIEGNGGLYINTAGIGGFPEGRALGFAGCRPGDSILLSGNLGDHHAAIYSARMGIENGIVSDCAPLNEPVGALFAAGVRVKAMRDVTRGGLATVLEEAADAAGCGISVYEEKIPVNPEVRGLCGLLGLDPLYMANEGKFIAVVAPEDTEKALAAVRSARYGETAAVIGRMTEGDSVTLHTGIGGGRRLHALYGEGLPRIC